MSLALPSNKTFFVSVSVTEKVSGKADLENAMAILGSRKLWPIWLARTKISSACDAGPANKLSMQAATNVRRLRPTRNAECGTWKSDRVASRLLLHFGKLVSATRFERARK